MHHNNLPYSSCGANILLTHVVLSCNILTWYGETGQQQEKHRMERSHLVSFLLESTGPHNSLYPISSLITLLVVITLSPDSASWPYHHVTSLETCSLSLPQVSPKPPRSHVLCAAGGARLTSPVRAGVGGVRHSWRKDAHSPAVRWGGTSDCYHTGGGPPRERSLVQTASQSGVCTPKPDNSHGS